MSISKYKKAEKTLSELVLKTPFEALENFTGTSGSRIMVKREDLQLVPSRRGVIDIPSANDVPSHREANK